MEDEDKVNPEQPNVPLSIRLKQRWLKSWPLAVGALVLSVWVFGPRLFKHPERPPLQVEETVDRQAKWEAVEQPVVPDLVWLDLNDDGTRGVAVASNGTLLTSADAGASWRIVRSPPIEASEIPSVAVFAGEGIVVGCGTDESRYTTVYEWSDTGLWSKVEGVFGGVAGASSDGSVLVGGGGMVALRQGVHRWKFSSIKEAGELTLYGASREGKQIVVVGDYGFIGTSEDEGRTWKTEYAGEAALYGVTTRGVETALAVGAGGLYERIRGKSRWQITGREAGSPDALTGIVSTRQVVYAIGERKGEPLLLKSTNGGQSWERELTGEPYDYTPRTEDDRLVAIAAANDVIVTATATGKIYRRLE
ncbi:MAG: hypothetical protein H0T92_25505 [Pyrinomonadaceae bacterium]|nr:hypothetical protein [Pyrinomonadaceae bacterium]